MVTGERHGRSDVRRGLGRDRTGAVTGLVRSEPTRRVVGARIVLDAEGIAQSSQGSGAGGALSIGETRPKWHVDAKESVAEPVRQLRPVVLSEIVRHRSDLTSSSDDWRRKAFTISSVTVTSVRVWSSRYPSRS